MMSIDLSPGTLERVLTLFEAHEVGRASEILVHECADNLPLWRPATPEGLERIRFAVLKMSNGRLAALEKAVELARTDWRDALVDAGFAHDVNAHRAWRPAPVPGQDR